MKIILTLFSLVLLSSFSAVHAQEMEFYQNEKYDFSFEMPIDWRYQEDITIEPNMYPVMLFPEEFIIENFAGGDLDLMDMQMKLMGFEFQFESPLLGVDFRNIPESLVLTLNEKNLQEYVLDEILTVVPDAEIINSYTKSHSWGWEVYTKYNYDMDIGLDPVSSYSGEELIFIFEDREAYNISYGAQVSYYDEYRFAFDHMLDTLIIKSITVPQISEELDSKVQNIFDDVDETDSYVESVEIADKNIDEMTDEELLERFQELMNYGEELTPPIEALLDETAAAEFMEKMDAWYAEVKQIIKIMTERGWEISPVVVTREDGSELEILDFSDPDDIKLNQELFEILTLN